MNLDTQPHPAGTLVAVQAHPGARKNELRGIQGGVLKVSVTQAPEKGKANKALVEVVAQALSLRPSQVELVSGETSRRKRLLIRGIQPDELIQRLVKILGDSTGDKA